MIEIVYVGRKLVALDNVAQSGKTWAGYGDTQSVTERQARLLLKYPDQWELSKDSDAPAVAKEQIVRFIDPSGDRVEVPETALKLPLEKMTANQLRAYAITTFNKTFSVGYGRKRLLDEIEEMAKGMDPMVRVESVVTE